MTKEEIQEMMPKIFVLVFSKDVIIGGMEDEISVTVAYSHDENQLSEFAEGCKFVDSNGRARYSLGNCGWECDAFTGYRVEVLDHVKDLD